MKAIAVIPARRQIRLIEQPEPPIERPTQVKLRMVEVGLCGTDREIAAFAYGTPPPGEEALVIGHESLGEVVAVGSAVTRVSVGDLAVPMVRRPCPHATCVACRADRQDFCYTGDFTERGIKQAHGFLTEFVVDEERYMHRVPPALRAVAVLAEPLTIAEKALMQVWQVQQRLPWACAYEPGRRQGYCHNALVLGAGPVGLLGAMALVADGFKTYVYSRQPAESPQGAVTAAIGATYISSTKERIEELAGRIGNIDLVYEATGASQLSFQVMEVLGTNGVFVFTGVPGRKGPIELDADHIMRNLFLKNQVVYGTVNASREAYEEAINDLGLFMQRWPAAVRDLITMRHPPAACPALLQGNVEGIKHVISFAGTPGA